jgi:cytoskeletal protein CcmA (bactofilin family)
MALFSKDPAPAPRPPARAEGSAPHGGGTFIGPNITVDGRISGTEPVTVEGSVRGKIDLSADLLVGPKARIEATVHARNVTIEGKVTGDISADERVELVATSTVDGNIKAPKIVVAEGARFRGNVDMGSKVPRDLNGSDQAPARAK